MARPLVSVIVLNWNGLEVLKKCFPSVAESTYENLELIVVDNASTDESTSWLKKTYPDTAVHKLDSNLGYTGGNNAGIRAASGELIVLLNNDVEVSPGWLEPMVDAMQDQTIAAVQPKLLQYDERQLFEYAGASGGHIDRNGFPFARGRMLFTFERDTGQYDARADIFWATGAAIMLRASCLEEVGLLDEAFELHMEEIDLCWRLRRAGYRIVAVPDSVAYHIGGASLPRGNPRKTYFNYRNSRLMLYKNLTAAEWPRVQKRRRILDGIAATRFLLTGNWAEFRAIREGCRDAKQMLANYEHAKTDPSVFPSYRGNIVWDYFLARRKTFQALDAKRFGEAYR